MGPTALLGRNGMLAHARLSLTIIVIWRIRVKIVRR